jgi:hypothetical protein
MRNSRPYRIPLSPFFRLWIAYQMEIEEVKTRQPPSKEPVGFPFPSTPPIQKNV